MGPEIPVWKWAHPIVPGVGGVDMLASGWQRGRFALVWPTHLHFPP